MTIQYIMSQVCVILAVILLAITYMIKDKKIILFLSIMISILYGTQYLLLWALTGVAMNGISIIRSVWFYINAKNKRKNSLLVLEILIAITLIFGIFTYKNIFSIFPIISTILYTYSIWQDDVKMYRYLAIPISFSWITYNVYSRTLFGVVNEIILLTIVIVNIVKQKKKIK